MGLQELAKPCTQEGMEASQEQNIHGVAQPQKLIVLSLGNDVVQSVGAGLGPHARFVSNDVRKPGDGGLFAVKDASVLVLPKPPGREDDKGGQTFARRGW